MNLRPGQIDGFYSVLDTPSRDLALALLASSPIMQVRRKPASPEELESLARLAREVTAMVGALLFINDDIDLAHRVGADGVHLGQDDTPLAIAKRRTDLLIGVSTHDEAQLDAALSGGANYVAYGPIFATKTKKDPDPQVGLEGLAMAASKVGSVPLVAIGGITSGNIASVVEAGASTACVISAVNKSKNPRMMARSLADAFRP